MKRILLTLLSVPLLAGCQDSCPIKAKIAQSPKTFCNPVNLNYRFMKIDGGEGIREAADPVVVSFKDTWYLFASKSSGYWYSKDFTDWTHVMITDSVLPIEDYAPGLFVHNDYLYYVGSTHGKGMLYRSAQPEKGEWEPVKEILSYWDPAFYVEGDNLYLYHGCSPVDPIRMQVLDLNTLEARSEIIDCLNSDKEKYGWERTGELNELPRRPYIEGAWMTAHGGKYYLQYAGPGTEWKAYADGVYDTPHDYTEFEAPFQARYIKLQNKAYTVSDNLSVRDLRIFGNGLGDKPAAVSNFTVVRNESDPCKAALSWTAAPGADGYIVRYGIAADKLYNNFQVMGDTKLDINSLNAGVAYYFTVDTYNENGITQTPQNSKQI